MSKINRITPCLWFDGQAEEAAGFYVGIFKHAKITETSYFGKEGYEVHRRPAGSVIRSRLSTPSPMSR